jgi:hypothetical protein
MGNIIPDNYLAPPSQPWGREVTARLQALEERFEGALADTSTSAGQITNTLNYLASQETFIIENNTVVTNSTAVTGSPNPTLKTLTLTFFLPRQSKLLITATGVGSSNANTVSGALAYISASTFVYSGITIDSGTSVATAVSGSQTSVTSTRVTVQDFSLHKNEIVRTLGSGFHTIVAVFTCSNNGYAANGATGNSATRTLSFSSIIAQVIG